MDLKFEVLKNGAALSGASKILKNVKVTGQPVMVRVPSIGANKRALFDPGEVVSLRVSARISSQAAAGASSLALLS
jgi:hypothetical protein